MSYRKGIDAKADGPDQALKPVTNETVVIDYINDRIRFFHAGTLAVQGRVNWKTDPSFGDDSAQSRPPCASMIDRLIGRPIPMPCARVVKKGSKSRVINSGDTPTPVSITEIST
jgi:hypothetical protein